MVRREYRTGQGQSQESAGQVTSLVEVAYHEAGHAVMCVLREMPFEYVTIVPDGASFGHVNQANIKQYLQPWALDRVAAFIDVCLAGCLAATLADERYNNFGCTQDFLEAMNLAQLLEGEDLADVCIRLRTKLAFEQLSLHWNKVEIVARALTTRKHLWARQVRDLCSGAS